MGGFGLFRYLKEKRGRQVSSVIESDREGVVEVIFEGDNNKITVNQNVYKLSQDSQIIGAVKEVLRPALSPDIDKIEFTRGNSRIETVEKAEAEVIIAYEAIANISASMVSIEPQIVDARLTIYSPVFDENSKTWKFIYGGQRVKVDISELGIAEDVLRRGAIRIGDAYVVKLQIGEHKTEKGFRNDYKAICFTQFLPAQSGSQTSLLDLLDPDES
jgi:hypothetical protein